MKRIVWIASYPKSGNTWLRVFLNSLLGEPGAPLDINDLARTPLASTRELFDSCVGLDSSDLPHDQVDALRAEVYERLARDAGGTLFFKIHDGYTLLADGRPLIPPSATKGALYLVRNPLDVAVSFSHHGGWDLDTTIANMGEEGFTFGGAQDQLATQLRQRLLSWSGHVESWLLRAPFPVELLRYEDMKRDPHGELARAARFAGLDAAPERVAAAVRASEFSLLQQQEAEHGFSERSPRARSFFRKGEADAWRGELQPAQVARIVERHRDAMERLGYDTRLERLLETPLFSGKELR